MSAVLVAAALVVATGSIAALASADARLGLVGLAVALVGAGLLADPLPGPAVLGVRLTAALLAVAILRAAIPLVENRRPVTEPEAAGRTHLGWPPEALLAIGGAVAGAAISAGLASFAPITGTGERPAVAFLGGSPLAAASLALALAGGLAAISLPALLSGAGLRRATAAVLAVQGAVLARVGLAGAPGVLEEIALAVLLVTVAAAAALLAGAGRTLAEGGSRQA